MRCFLTYNLISKNNALGIVVLEPFISGFWSSKHLEVIGVTDVFVRINVKTPITPEEIFRAIGRLRKEARDEIDRLIRFLDDTDTLKRKFEVVCYLLSRDVPSPVCFSAQRAFTLLAAPVRRWGRILPSAGSRGLGSIFWGSIMIEHVRLAPTPRDRFFEAAQKELLAFERREREFRKKDLEERAAQLQIPVRESEFRN